MQTETPVRAILGRPDTYSIDLLKRMFEMQEVFMQALQQKKGLDVMPEWPLDLSEKKNQQLCKSLAYDSMSELFEAIQHLKNSKPHRSTEIKEFDYDEFKEELVDAFKFFLEILIYAGVTPEEFYDSYQKKDDINHKRLANGY